MTQTAMPAGRREQEEPRTAPRRPSWPRAVKYAVVVIGVPLLGALGSWAKDAASAWKEVAEQRAAEQRAQMDVDLRVYEYAVSALGKDGSTQQQVLAVGLVEELVSNRGLRLKLLRVLRDQGKGDAPKAAAFAQEQSSVEKQPEDAAPTPVDSARPSWRSVNFDIFYCETSASQKLAADRLASAMHDRGTSGRIRVRLLPAVVNQRPGYEVHGYQIRPEESERAVAEEMLKEMSAALPAHLDVLPSGMSTPNYISIFFCP